MGSNVGTKSSANAGKGTSTGTGSATVIKKGALDTKVMKDATSFGDY